MPLLQLHWGDNDVAAVGAAQLHTTMNSLRNINIDWERGKTQQLIEL
jgi:hypothetical protein